MNAQVKKPGTVPESIAQIIKALTIINEQALRALFDLQDPRSDSEANTDGITDYTQLLVPTTSREVLSAYVREGVGVHIYHLSAGEFTAVLSGYLDDEFQTYSHTGTLLTVAEFVNQTIKSFIGEQSK